MKPILFIFSGLPATGKSTLAKLLAQNLNAAYVRIDTVEQALRDLCSLTVQGEGYRLAYRIAADNLNCRRDVVADSCNPWALTRSEWENVAIENNAEYINIEVFCSNSAEHKRRAEERSSEIAGLVLPSWEAIVDRDYHAWDKERIMIDTAGKSIEKTYEELLSMVRDAITRKRV